jgi:two-component system response regulator AtoC
VRELENMLERAVVLADGELLTEADLPDYVSGQGDPVAAVLGSGELSIKRTTRFVEETLIRKALDRTQGNRTQAAKLLEISHRALLYKLKELGIA